VTGTLPTANGGTNLTSFTSGGVVYASSSSALATGSDLTFSSGKLAVGNFQFYRDATNGNCYVFDTTTAPYSGPMIFGTTNTERMRIDISGNVGIGTSSPASKLDVSSPSTVLRLTSTTGTNSVYQRISNDGGQLYFGIDNSAGNDLASGSTAYAGVLIAPGTTRNLHFGTNGTVRATIDPSGNLGLGVTPSAWNTGFKALQIGAEGALWSSTSTAATWLTRNVFLNTSSSFRYIASDYANALQIDNDGAFKFYTAASGTAGNPISFTQAMTLDASGNLMVGTTTATGANIDVYESSSGDANIRIGNAQDASTTTIGKQGASSYGATSAGDSFLYTNKALSIMADGGANGIIKFATGGNTERARIDSSGSLLVGTTSTSGATGFAFISPSSSSVQRLIIGHVVGNTTGDTYHEFNYNSSQIGSITQVSTTGVLYNTTSDYRLKTVTGAVTGQGARLDALKPVNYLWIEGGQQARGFLAHEFQAVYSSSVNGTKDAVDENGNPKYQSMQAGSSEVIADLVAEIQSLRQRLSAANL
jgi:hypothetical protein